MFLRRPIRDSIIWAILAIFLFSRRVKSWFTSWGVMSLYMFLSSSFYFLTIYSLLCNCSSLFWSFCLRADIAISSPLISNSRPFYCLVIVSIFSYLTLILSSSAWMIGLILSTDSYVSICAVVLCSFFLSLPFFTMKSISYCFDKLARRSSPWVVIVI